MTEQPQTAKPSWSAQVDIPATIDAARSELADVAALLLAGDWHRAAIVWAWTEPQQGKRTDLQLTLVESSGGSPTSDSPGGSLSVSEFASLGIRGLTSHVTVAKYRAAWQAAMDLGRASAAVPGQPVDLPDMEWPKAEGGGSSAQAEREQDWQSPLAIVNAARLVLSGIDLDPASTPLANEKIQAQRIWTAADDGLVRPWQGRVYLCPPPYQPELGLFCMKLATEHAGGRVPAAVAVLPAETHADWAQNLGDLAAGLCFPRGKVQFWHPDREGGPARAVMIYYLGDGPAAFSKHFCEFGMCW